MAKVKIDKACTYSLAEVARFGFLPGLKSFSAVKNAVMRDRISDNVLQAQILGTGRATRVYIKGENIIKFVK